jgi:hypothetical protein
MNILLFVGLIFNYNYSKTNKESPLNKSILNKHSLVKTVNTEELSDKQYSPYEQSRINAFIEFCKVITFPSSN